MATLATKADTSWTQKWFREQYEPWFQEARPLIEQHQYGAALTFGSGYTEKMGLHQVDVTPFLFGGAEGDRTPDLMNAIHARSQLRHSPTN